MKAVIYARYSSDNQREESIEGQLRECKEYADKNGITILCSYIDRALSAKTDNRPEFQKMVQDSAKGLFDTVLVWKLDRFARNRYDSAHYKAVLRRNGVKVVSATENISDGPEGIILESMLEGMAEYYSAELAQKINRGLTENALKGKNNGGGIPLGYQLTDDQHLRIDPLTAPIVREIYQRYAEGETVRSIITSLNERHILTQKQKPFRPNSLHSVLCNRKYIGEYRYKDIIIPDGVPSIIPKDLFERVQMRVEKNKRTPARAKAEEEYLLTTKLFCGHCGRMMIGESGKSHTGAIYRYYKCSGAKRKLGCRKKAVKKDWIECIAVQYTIQRVFQDELIAQIADKLVELQNTEDNTLPLLRKQLADTNRGIENMLNAIQQGILTNSTKERLEELEKLREDLKASILQAELERPKYSREDIIEWISRFKYGDPSNKEYQRQIIDIFLNSIYVFDDRLVFTYNYKNGTQTVSLADVSAAFGSDLKSCTPPTKTWITGIQVFCFFPLWEKGRGKARSGRDAGTGLFFVSGGLLLPLGLFAEEEGLGEAVVEELDKGPHEEGGDQGAHPGQQAGQGADAHADQVAADAHEPEGPLPVFGDDDGDGVVHGDAQVRGHVQRGGEAHYQHTDGQKGDAHGQAGIGTDGVDGPHGEVHDVPGEEHVHQGGHPHVASGDEQVDHQHDGA